MSCHTIHPDPDRLYNIVNVHEILDPATCLKVTMKHPQDDHEMTCIIALYGVRCDYDYDEVVNNSMYVNSTQGIANALLDSEEIFYLQFGSVHRDGTQEGIMYGMVNGDMVNINSRMIKEGYFEETFGESIR